MRDWTIHFKRVHSRSCWLVLAWGLGLGCWLGKIWVWSHRPRLPPCGPLCSCLGFFTTWWLDSKSEHKERTRCTYATFFWSSLRCHVVSLPPHSVGWGSYKHLPRFKGSGHEHGLIGTQWVPRAWRMKDVATAAFVKCNLLKGALEHQMVIAYYYFHSRSLEINNLPFILWASQVAQW